MTRAVVLNKDDFACMGHLVMSGDIFDKATAEVRMLLARDSIKCPTVHRTVPHNTVSGPKCQWRLG